MGQRQLPILNGLRALGVLAVMFGHANLLRPIYGMVIYPRDVPVTGFFVLSGFLITLLLLRAHDKHGGFWLKLFHTGPVLRIWPAYIAFLA